MTTISQNSNRTSWTNNADHRRSVDDVYLSFGTGYNGHLLSDLSDLSSMREIALASVPCIPGCISSSATPPGSVRFTEPYFLSLQAGIPVTPLFFSGIGHELGLR